MTLSLRVCEGGGGGIKTWSPVSLFQSSVSCSLFFQSPSTLQVLFMCLLTKGIDLGSLTGRNLVYNEGMEPVLQYCVKFCLAKGLVKRTPDMW